MKLTKRDLAILTTRTGHVFGNFSEAHKYMEELLERPVQTFELADKHLVDKLKKLASKDAKEVIERMQLMVAN